MNEFHYPSAVGANELRLLQPGSLSHNSLHFRLLTFARKAAPSYAAVSYTWGDAAASEVIHLNNRRFHVRPNLWSCLYYLGLGTGRHDTPKYLWVDAICIDQTNNTERNAQVSLMHQTYNEAACVSVWLGLAALPEFYPSLQPAYASAKIVDIDIDWQYSMTDLANRPYWSRMWVIQEFLLARNVTLYCSGNGMDWQDFKSILCREADVYEFSTDTFKPVTRATGSYGALPLVMGRHVDKHPEVLQPLYDLLISHCGSKCKDPKDRIFALIGLVTEEEQRYLRRFFPDYEMSDDVVLVIAVAHLLQFSILIPSQVGNVSLTPDSEELFMGLGVESKEKRRKLLRQAKTMDYLSEGLPDHVHEMLAFHDMMREYGGVDLAEEDDTVDVDFLGSSMTRRSTAWLWLLVIPGAFVVWKWWNIGGLAHQ